jgi:transposase
VVWIFKSNRSALKRKERPGSDVGPFCISLHGYLDDDSCMEVTAHKGSSGDLQHFPDLECAPGAGQVEVGNLTGVLGFRKMKAMARQQRSHSIEFKRQVVQEYIAGETLYGLAKRHDLSRQLIRVWVEKYEAGGLDADAQAADLLHEYETKIVALERMVGRQALEIEFLKGALKNAPRPRSATTSVIAGPTASPSQKDAG